MRVFPFFLLLILFSCDERSGAAYLKVGDASNAEYAPVEDAFEDLLEVPATTQSPPPPAQEQQNSESITQKLIKTGGIDFQSKDIAEDFKKIKALLPNYGAYIEKENQRKSGSRIAYDLTIRVPSRTYDTLYANLSGIAYELDNRYSNVEDVTERFYDLKTRIKNKKVLEQRYLDLLKKASAIKDILQIERNLNEVRTDIERLQGQFNYLSKQIQLSTINLSFYEFIPYKGTSSNKRTFLDRIVTALGNGWDAFQSFLVGLFSIWPFLLLIAGMIWLARRLRKNWKRRKKGQ